MSQVDPLYEKALSCLMKLADAEAMPDMEVGWPGPNGLFHDIPNLNVDQLDKDLKCVLVEKANGTVHTKVVNGLPKGGVYVYTDIYKWFTETSGLGGMEQVRKLMHFDKVNMRRKPLRKLKNGWRSAAGQPSTAHNLNYPQCSRQ